MNRIIGISIISSVNRVLQGLLKVIPIRVSIVELLAIEVQENQGRKREEDSEEGTPQRDVVDKGLVCDSVVEHLRGQLEVEPNSIAILNVYTIDH